MADEYPDVIADIADSVVVSEQELDKVYKTPGVIILGHDYRPGCCLVLNYIDDVPQFGIVEAILIIKDLKVFIVNCMHVKYFDRDIMSYVLELKNERVGVQFSQFFSKWPLSVYTCAGKKCVINEYSHTCELL